MSYFRAFPRGGYNYKQEYVGVPTRKITVGFKPKQLFVQLRYNGSQQWDEKCLYDETVSTTTYQEYANATVRTATMGDNNALIYSIDADGFTFRSDIISPTNLLYQVAYMAIG